MANPESITVTDTTPNNAVSQPDAQSIDTNGTIPVAVGGRTDRLIFEVVNDDNAALTFKVLAGDNPPAIQAPAGDLSVALAASGGGATAKRIVGPFESARFLQADGTINVSFQAATGAPAASIRCYRLPNRF